MTIPVYNMGKDWHYTFFSPYKKAIQIVGFEVYFPMKVVYICQLYTLNWCQTGLMQNPVYTQS